MIIKHYTAKGSPIVLISQGLLEQIYHSSMTQYPKEFGGIVSGIRLNNIWTIIDFQVPLKYDNSTNGFTRDAGTLNIYLESAFNESRGQVEYLGEWHSHPNGTTKYSDNDRKSMMEIAEDINIKNDSPLLLIIGNSKKSFKYSLFQYIEGNLLEHKITQI